jgi:hypothetical protein
MDRTTAPGSIAGQYIDDDPANEIQGTLLVAKDRNAIQEELINVITAAGLTPSAGTLTQLRDAVRNASNLSTGTLPDARLSNLVKRQSRATAAATGAGWYEIATGRWHDNGLLQIHNSQSNGWCAILASISNSLSVPKINILAASTAIQNPSTTSEFRITHLAARYIDLNNIKLYAWCPGTSPNLTVVSDNLTGYSISAVTPTLFSATFENIANPTTIRYNEGIDAARIGGQLASNIPKLDQANTFSSTAIQTTGQQIVDIGNNYNLGSTKGVKVDGLFLGANTNGQQSLILLAPVYVSGILPATGFIGRITGLRGGVDAIQEGIVVDVRCVTAYNTTFLGLNGDFGAEFVTVVYETVNYYALRFTGTAQKRFVISGILFGATPTFIPSTSGLSPILVPPASLRSLRGKFNAGDLAEGTLADGRFPATLPALSGANLTNLNASNLSAGTLAEARLPFFPVEQGGQSGMSGNKIRIGWTGTKIKLGVDGTNQGDVWTDINDGAGSGLDADLLDGVQGSGYVKWAEFNPWLVYSNYSASAQTYTLPDMAVGAVFTYYIRLRNVSDGTIFNTVRLPSGGTYSFDVRHGEVSGSLSDGTAKDITAFWHDYANSVGGTGTVASVGVSAGNTGLFIAKVRRIS